MYYPTVTEYRLFSLKNIIYLHWSLYLEYLNIQNLNNLFVMIELFPIPDLLAWRMHTHTHTHIYIYTNKGTLIRKHFLFW